MRNCNIVCKLFILLVISISVLIINQKAEANLIDRGNGLVYDSDLDITWISNAGLGGSRTYNGVNGAVAYVDGLVYAGYSDWRLPTAHNAINPNLNRAIHASELAHLFYAHILSLPPPANSNVLNNALLGSPYFYNIALFAYSTSYWDDTVGGKFSFTTGQSSDNPNSDYNYVWPVRNGDPARTHLPPTADAGDWQVVDIGTMVSLDASLSSDPEGDYPLTYSWTLLAPQGSNALLSNVDTVNPTFTPDVEGNYYLKLIVNDSDPDRGSMASEPLRYFVTTTNATLQPRAGGTMIYDTHNNVTWLADANYARTNKLSEVPGSGFNAGGYTDWDNAMAWVSNFQFGGYSDWQLPYHYTTPAEGETTWFKHLYFDEFSAQVNIGILEITDPDYYLFPNLEVPIPSVGSNQRYFTDYDGALFADPDSVTVGWQFYTGGLTTWPKITPSLVWPSRGGDVGNGGGPPVVTLSAIAGANQTVQCSGATTNVNLSGASSDNSDNSLLTFTWSGTFGSATGISTSLALPLGSHIITLTVSDGVNADAVDEIMVVVEDTMAPTVSAGGDIVLEAQGPDGVAYSLVPSSNDACGLSSTTLSPSLITYPLGTTTVTVTVVDGAGLTASDTVNITVVDTTPPDLTAPADITLEATGPLSAVGLGTAVAYDTVSGNLIALADNIGPFSTGVHNITWSVVDGSGNISTANQVVTILNAAPICGVGLPIVVSEGENFSRTVNFTDVNSTSFTTSIDYGDGSPIVHAPVNNFSFQLSHQYANEGTYLASVSIIDNHGGVTTDYASITVENSAPVLGEISASGNISVGGNYSLSFPFTDGGSNDTHICVIDWGDGTTSLGTIIDGVVYGDHVYAEPGFYNIGVTLTDDGGAVATDNSQSVSVYSPTCGFVTGRKHMTSPFGALSSAPAYTGQASFQFVLKYLRKSPFPQGKIDFALKDAGFKFHSKDFSYLVVSGNRGEFAGNGSVNGGGGYAFIATLVDGNIRNLEGDRFRLKVWDKVSGNVVYDSQPGDLNNSAPVNGLLRGNIIVHQRHKKCFLNKGHHHHKKRKHDKDDHHKKRKHDKDDHDKKSKPNKNGHRKKKK